jgi:glycosyltransferase involved in cell wall biosynthesis
MGDPLVSVVVPTYNRAYCLERALSSALSQTHRNLEVVVVDDGSTDATEELVSTLSRRDSRVRLFKQTNKGVAAARNAGFAQCTGEFVALLDSDDVWRTWKIELQLACMARYPEVGMTWTDMQAIDADGREVSGAYLRTMYSAWDHFSLDDLFKTHVPVGAIAVRFANEHGSRLFHFGEIFSEMLVGNFVHTPTVLLRRDRLDKVGGFDESLCPAGEDYDFHLRTCREGPVGFIDLPAITYQVGMADALSRHAVSLSTNFLKVVNRTLTEDRYRIDLPQAKIDWLLGDANAWVGEVMLNEGEDGKARKHLMTSLRYRPFHVRTAKLAALSIMPHVLRSTVRSLLGRR